MPAGESAFMLLQFRSAPGTSLDASEDLMTRNEQWFLDQPEVATVFAKIGSRNQSIDTVNEGMINIKLMPHDQRERSVEEFKRDAREAMLQIPGQEVALLNPMGHSQREFEILIQGNESLEELDRYAQLFVQRLKEEGGFTDLDTSLRLGLPEARVVPDRDKAAALGVNASTVAEVVQSMIGGLDVARFREGENTYDVRLRMEPSGRQTLADIGDLWVRARNGELVDLRNLVRIETGATASQISRIDRVRSVEVVATLDGIALDEAVERARAIAEETLPRHIELGLAGDAEAMKEAGQEFTLMLVLAVLVVYMVLASQFESFTQPLIVMLALPFSMTGALGGLWVLGMSLNMFSMIGILLLLGLVTKNSILLIDYANQLREKGETAYAAIRRAAPVRMRPVLMTALSMIFGVLPAAVGVGPGAESRQPMAVATAAGMFSSMLLTLLVVPVFYLGLDDLGAWLRAKLAGWRGASATAQAPHRV